MKGELDVLRLLVHPNIPKVYGVHEDADAHYIITEFVKGGDLLGVMGEHEDGLSEKNVGKIIKQTLLALNYLHSKNFVHRDVKLENLLVSG